MKALVESEPFEKMISTGTHVPLRDERAFWNHMGVSGRMVSDETAHRSQ